MLADRQRVGHGQHRRGIDDDEIELALKLLEHALHAFRSQRRGALVPLARGQQPEALDLRGTPGFAGVGFACG